MAGRYDSDPAVYDHPAGFRVKWSIPISQMPPPLTAPDAVPRAYWPELDVIRFGAFVLVFLSHVMPGEREFYALAHIPSAAAAVTVSVAAGGAFGVDLFFALSSFLITTLLLRERQLTGHIDVVSFYVRRILRIWPLYFTFLLVIAPLVRSVLPADRLPSLDAAAFALMVGNWAFVLWGYAHTIVGPLWSVSVEEQFYLAWPLLLRRVSTRVPATLLGMWLMSTAVRTALVLAGAVHPQIWCNTLAHLDPIACGGLLAVLAGRRAMTFPSWLRVVLLGSGVGVFAVAARFGDFAGPRSLITYPAVSLAACAIIASTLHVKWDLNPRAWLRGLVYLGKVSYGLYVFHLMFVELLGVGAAHTPGRRLALIGATLLCTVLAAAVSYHVMEQPFLALKRRFTLVPSRPL